MAIVEMQKIRLYLHRDTASDVLRAVQKLGVVQFEEVTLEDAPLNSKEKEAFEFNYASSRLDFAVRFLSRYATPPKGLRGMIEGNKVRTTGTKLYETVKSFDYNPIIDATQAVEQKRIDARHRIEQLREEEALLAPWTPLELPLTAPRTTEHTRTLFLTTRDTESQHASERALAEAGVPCTLHAVSATHWTLTYHKAFEDQVHSILREQGSDESALPVRRGTPAEELERIHRAIAHLEEELVSAEEAARTLTEHLSNLKVLADYMLWQRTKHDLYTQALTSNHVLVFEGWCPKQALSALDEHIRNKTDTYALEQVEPQKNEVPPVEIENSKIVKPFESITRLYGLPGHTDLDPTPYLAGFFFLFFGLALTDVGYGLILTLGLGYILTHYQVPKNMTPMLWLMFAGGVSTTILGTLFGGYFGVSLEALPQWATQLQQFDPMQNPMPVFYLALILGVIQIVFGLVLHIVRAAKNGALADGLWSKGPWIALFIFGAAWLGSALAIIPGSTAPYSALVYACLGLIVLYAAYRETSWLMKPIKGVLSLYDIVAYFSDILSYSRLLALGLATSALAYAVNLIAGMVVGIPYIGFVLMVIILIIGHLFNLALNILGAFIHSARLQFVEFFGKFVEGSGRPYRPFRREERYVELVEH